MMLVLVANTVIGIVYLAQESYSHRNIIKPSSCRVMLGSLLIVNPELNITLRNIYDITSILSFVIAWIATTLMLKHYFKRRSKLGYWLLISLPLIFFLSRYEVGVYYLLGNQAPEILSSVTVNPNIYGSTILNMLINSNLQLGGALFGVAFLMIAMKLQKYGQLRKTLVLTGIGMMFLFGSKDISTQVIFSYPPSGVVSIAFMGLASYLVYIGIQGIAKLTARDTKLRKDLRDKIEGNMALLKSIASSQNHIDTEKKVKQLIDLSTQWQEANQQHDMTQEEIKEIVNDVISEIKITQKKT